jgi:hypothetical protein
MRPINNISVYNERDLKSLKDIWLYEIDGKERIVIKHIVFYEGTGEVKVSLFDYIELVKEITFVNTNDFYSFLAKYSKLPY